MTVKKESPVEIVTSHAAEKEAVRLRLRTLLELAVAIGKREGLLGNSSDSRGNLVTEDATTRQSEETATANREITEQGNVHEEGENGKGKTVSPLRPKQYIYHTYRQTRL